MISVYNHRNKTPTIKLKTAFKVDNHVLLSLLVHIIIIKYTFMKSKPAPKYLTMFYYHCNTTTTQKGKYLTSLLNIFKFLHKKTCMYIYVTFIYNIIQLYVSKTFLQQYNNTLYGM